MSDLLTIRLAHQAMGTKFETVLCGDDRDHLIVCADEAFEEIDRLDEQMSLYIETSEICWINANAAREPVKVEPELFRLLQLAAKINTDTEGAFDITIGPLVKCWGFFRGDGKTPPRDRIAAALKKVGMAHVKLNEKDMTIRFDSEGVGLDLGGIGKGCAVQKAAEILIEQGITRALVHGGTSTVYAIGSPPQEADSKNDGWPLGIRHPYDSSRRVTTVDLKDKALSTSGSYEKFFKADGKLYSHIIDPRQGYPAQGMLSATAITTTATESDALSTAFFVLGVQKTREYCRVNKGVQAILIPQPKSSDGSELECVQIGFD